MPETPRKPRHWSNTFTVTCPCCAAMFEAQRPERPFIRATPSSTAPVPPDLRTPPKHHAARVVVCAHCGSQYRPARGTRNPRYCSKSCSRRAALARKHGYWQDERLQAAQRG